MTTKYLPGEDIALSGFIVRVMVWTTRFPFHGSVKQLLVDYLRNGPLNYSLAKNIITKIFLITEYAGETFFAESLSS